jgi:2-methylcitrate dehydratase PrpD
VVLALGEENKISGKEALFAFTLGVEIECKIGRGTIPRHYENGWHPTSSIGIFGAATAAAKILGLSEQELIYAFGIAGSESSGLRENFGTMTKPFHAGRAAAKGIMAALLAKEGLTSTEDIFEGEAGFCKVMAGDYDEKKIIDRLGNPFDAEDPGFTIKPYPTCGATHPAIDAVISLSQEYDLKLDQIEKIECGTVPIAKDILIYPRPKSPLEGKFSMHYCLAIALAKRKVGLSHFTDDRIDDPEIRQFLERVDMYIAPEMADLGYRGTFNAKIKIVLKDGKEYITRVDHGRGDPANPLSEEELMEKYTDCAALTLDSERIKRSKEMLLDLEQLPDIGMLMEIISA